MRALEFITGHVIFKLSYNQIYQLTLTNVCYETPQKKGQQALHLYSIANFVAS